MEKMNMMRRWQCLTTVGLGLVLATLSGCQTWVPGAGITLPSPHYLEHPPQYIAPSPPFPLTRELANQEAINARPAFGAPGAGALPPQLPAAPPGAPPAGPAPGGAPMGPMGPGAGGMP
jgi:hypothetical protein